MTSFEARESSYTMCKMRFSSTGKKCQKSEFVMQEIQFSYRLNLLLSVHHCVVYTLFCALHIICSLHVLFWSTCCFAPYTIFCGLHSLLQSLHYFAFSISFCTLHYFPMCMSYYGLKLIILPTGKQMGRVVNGGDRERVTRNSAQRMLPHQEHGTN